MTEVPPLAASVAATPAWQRPEPMYRLELANSASSASSSALGGGLLACDLLAAIILVPF